MILIELGVVLSRSRLSRGEEFPPSRATHTVESFPRQRFGEECFRRSRWDTGNLARQAEPLGSKRSSRQSFFRRFDCCVFPYPGRRGDAVKSTSAEPTQEPDTQRATGRAAFTVSKRYLRADSRQQAPGNPDLEGG